MYKILFSTLLLALSTQALCLPEEYLQPMVVPKFIKPFNDSNTTCIMCEGIVNLIVFEEHKVNSTIGDIIQIIKGVCDIVKGPRGQECLTILNDVQGIINLISKGFSSQQICSKLHFC